MSGNAHTTYSHAVRFGDITVSGLMHHAKVFDLCIRALEAECNYFEVTIADIVDAGGVPYAPVDVRGEFHDYPRLDERLVVTAQPIEVGDNHFRTDYHFSAEPGAKADGESGVATDSTGDSDAGSRTVSRSCGRVRMTHVTVAPEGGAGALDPTDKERLQNRLEPAGEDSELPGISETDTIGATFSKAVTFHTPHIEAAGLGYIEDYVDFMAATLEGYLHNEGVPLKSLDVDAPMVPVGWAFEFHQPIYFEDDIRIRARVTDLSAESITVEYALTGADAPADADSPMDETANATGDASRGHLEHTDVRLEGEMTYECWDGGETVAVPEALLDALESS